MADGEDGGVDDTDKPRLPSLGFVLSLVLFLFTILLLTIVIGETVGWFCGIANLVWLESKGHSAGDARVYSYRVNRCVCIVCFNLI